MQDFICSRCVRKNYCGEGDGDGGSGGLVVDGGVLEEVQQVCYLGGMFYCGGSSESKSGSYMLKMA